MLLIVLILADRRSTAAGGSRHFWHDQKGWSSSSASMEGISTASGCLTSTGS